jgi:cation-transporting ATPase E
MGIARIEIFFLFLSTPGDLRSAQVALTYALVVFGLLLYLFLEPFCQAWVGSDQRTGYWLHILVVIGLYVRFEVAVRTWIGPELFRMEPLRGPLDYLVIGLVVLVWAVVLRYTWRHRLVERYLRLDFADL